MKREEEARTVTDITGTCREYVEAITLLGACEALRGQ
jgi:hypothetical protein